VILFILFFTLLTGTRSIINIIKFDGLTASTKEEISDDLEEFEGDCQIVNGSVTCAESGLYYLFSSGDIAIYITEEYTDEIEGVEGSFLYVQGDTLYLKANNITMPYVTLSDLPESLHDMDFGNLTNGNEELVEEPLFAGLDELTTSTKLYWGIGLLAVEFILNGVMLFGFVLISAFFLRKRFTVISFRDCFVLSTYASTSVFILLVFFSLIEVSFFVLLLLIILAFRQNGLMIEEINRRLKKPLDKE